MGDMAVHGCVEAVSKGQSPAHMRVHFMVVLGVLSPFRGSSREMGVKLSPPWNGVISAVDPSLGRRAKKSNEQRGEDPEDEEEEEEEEEIRNRRRGSHGQGNRSNRRSQEEDSELGNETREKNKICDDSPQSQPGHVDLPIPRRV